MQLLYPINNLHHVPRNGRRPRKLQYPVLTPQLPVAPPRVRLGQLVPPRKLHVVRPQEARPMLLERLVGARQLFWVAVRPRSRGAHTTRVEAYDLVVLGAVDDALEAGAPVQGELDAGASRPAGVEEDGAAEGGGGGGDGGGALYEGDGDVVGVRGVQPVEGDSEARAVVVIVAGVVAEDLGGLDGGPVEGLGRLRRLLGKGAACQEGEGEGEAAERAHVCCVRFGRLVLHSAGRRGEYHGMPDGGLCHGTMDRWQLSLVTPETNEDTTGLLKTRFLRGEGAAPLILRACPLPEGLLSESGSCPHHAPPDGLLLSIAAPQIPASSREMWGDHATGARKMPGEFLD